MKVLSQFQGKCRGTTIDYTLIQLDNELILEAYNPSDDTLDTLTWSNTKENLRLINTACNTIKGR